MLLGDAGWWLFISGAKLWCTCFLLVSDFLQPVNLQRIVSSLPFLFVYVSYKCLLLSLHFSRFKCSHRCEIICILVRRYFFRAEIKLRYFASRRPFLYFPLISHYWFSWFYFDNKLKKNYQRTFQIYGYLIVIGGV